VEARFSAPAQTGPGAHPAFYTMGTGSFLGIKRPGRGVDHPLTSRIEVKVRAEIYFYYPPRFVACTKANFTFTFTPMVCSSLQLLKSTLCIHFSPYLHVTCPFFLRHPHNFRWGLQIVTFEITKFSVAWYDFPPLRCDPFYHSVFEQTWLLFFPSWARPSLTPIQNNMLTFPSLLACELSMLILTNSGWKFPKLLLKKCVILSVNLNRRWGESGNRIFPPQKDADSRSSWRSRRADSRDIYSIGPKHTSFLQEYYSFFLYPATGRGDPRGSG